MGTAALGPGPPLKHLCHTTICGHCPSLRATSRARHSSARLERNRSLSRVWWTFPYSVRVSFYVQTSLLQRLYQKSVTRVRVSLPLEDIASGCPPGLLLFMD